MGRLTQTTAANTSNNDRASGGPYYQVELGRYDDSRVSTRDSVVLPHGITCFKLDQLNAFFTSLEPWRELSRTDMIALSAIGHVHDMGRGAARRGGVRVLPVQDCHRPAMDSSFVAELCYTCSASASVSGGFAFLDGATPAAFDNAYYRDLHRGRSLLSSDQRRCTPTRCNRFIRSLSY
ncbi:hypothetical protein GUJ93_ZPchr0006g45563 [Zizania palustris]|uniref:Plant heme peroxidase family profile domain-containing protein n=1 Tax=Zizania palustris TaxID=103762 RepID=A0A8J5SHF3_ZIZPA|nr:hypothetical protein GUJ93_ZPchr0006g45563 [Zizania palustris]